MVIFEKQGIISIFSMGVDVLPLQPEMTFARLANGARIGLIYSHVQELAGGWYNNSRI